MATGPRRYFTQPLGSGRSARLGANDPRARRDANARVISVDDPLTTSVVLTEAEVQALIDAALEAQAAAAPPEEELSLTFEQGAYAFEDVTNFYVSYGVDGSWEAIQHSSTASLTTGAYQTGTRPLTLVQFQAVPAFPTPAP